MSQLEKFSDWVAEIVDETDEFAYRYIYAAYMWAASGSDYVSEYMRVERPDDGGYVLRYRDISLSMADDGERLAFADYLGARFTGTRHKDMGAWAETRHQGYVEDLTNWVSIPPSSED